MNSHQNEYYHKNKEKYRLYYLNNKDKIKKKAREYAIKNRDYVLQYQKDYYIHTRKQYPKNKNIKLSLKKNNDNIKINYCSKDKLTIIFD